MLRYDRAERSYTRFTHVDAAKAVAGQEGKVWTGTRGGVAWAEFAEPDLQDPLIWKTDAGVGAVTDLLVASDTLFAAADERIVLDSSQIQRDRMWR